MADEEQNEAQAPTFLRCAAEVARLVGINGGTVAKDQRARRLALAVRRPLLERATLPEELLAPLMAAAVYDPDPSFCRWFVEPALYAFGRRRVRDALVEYLRTGTDAERAGAMRAWYCAHLPLRADRSPAYAPHGTRDPGLDESQTAVDAWLEALLHLYAQTADPQMHHRIVLNLPTSPEAYPPHLHELLEGTVAAAGTHPSRHIRAWAVEVGQTQ
ncbi:hypothetical protein AB0B01_27370 [Streptomyces sp. NPDC044571]|uniref:hypothetical protein n=1 Tax=Streptomyces sp. NPDC044571 TaxID=3155371 RepID=UPI0033F3A449